MAELKDIKPNIIPVAPISNPFTPAESNANEVFKQAVKAHGELLRHEDPDKLAIRAEDLLIDRSSFDAGAFERLSRQQPDYLKHLLDVALEQAVELNALPVSIRRKARKELERRRREAGKTAAANHRRIVTTNLRSVKEKSGLTNQEIADKLAELLGVALVSVSRVISHTRRSWPSVPMMRSCRIMRRSTAFRSSGSSLPRRRSIATCTDDLVPVQDQQAIAD